MGTLIYKKRQLSHILCSTNNPPKIIIQHYFNYDHKRPPNKANKRLMITGKRNRETIHNTNTCHKRIEHKHQTNDAQKYFPCNFITID